MKLPKVYAMFPVFATTSEGQLKLFESDESIPYLELLVSWRKYLIKGKGAGNSLELRSLQTDPEGHVCTKINEGGYFADYTQKDKFSGKVWVPKCITFFFIRIEMEGPEQ